jgi:hypothetical protein
VERVDGVAQADAGVEAFLAGDAFVGVHGGQLDALLGAVGADGVVLDGEAGAVVGLLLGAHSDVADGGGGHGRLLSGCNNVQLSAGRCVGGGGPMCRVLPSVSCRNTDTPRFGRRGAGGRRARWRGK